MAQAVLGIVAPVDAGKTTLAEALLARAGAIRAAGRVDRGTAHMDFDPMERDRGITIFSATAQLEHDGCRLTLVDTPGHGDLVAECERVLPVLDMAVLLVSASDGVTGATRTLWRLLEHYAVPTTIFVSKMDQPTADGETTVSELRRRLSDGCIPWDLPDRDEECATTDELALEEYLTQGELSGDTLARLVGERLVFPVFLGSALRDLGIEELLDGIVSLVRPRPWPADFGARVFNVSHGPKGERLTWLKVTGGELVAKSVVSSAGQPRAWKGKVDQVRIYSGERYEVVPKVGAGEICAVTGLDETIPGDGLGAEPAGTAPQMQPVLQCAVDCGEADPVKVHDALALLAEEDPLLQVSWSEEAQEVRLSLMGPIQHEVLGRLLAERFDLVVGFGPGRILYRETIVAPVLGIGHFEPLRHYAEAHLLLEPLAPGSGIQVGTVCPTDALTLNWQRLVLTHVRERVPKGVLAGAPLTDVRITLTAGRAHPKHTEGGDFRQATYRAIRQGLMAARAAGGVELLEPWMDFSLEVPEASLGRGLSDLQAMGARFSAPEVAAGIARLEGVVPASELGEYALTVASYTHGQGSLQVSFSGYEPCHDAAAVIAAAAYDPEADLAFPPDSVFCSHGAGHTVKWQDVPAAAHVEEDPRARTPWRRADAALFGQG